MTALYTPSHVAPGNREEPALWFAFRGGQVALCAQSDDPCLPCCMTLEERGLEPQRTHYLGTYDGQHCYAVALADSCTLPTGWKLIGLRDAFSTLELGLA